MIVASHLKEDISCLDESKCLLVNPIGNKFLVCSNEELSYLGCYLFHNRNEDAWIQSGSATGVGGIGKASIFILILSEQDVIGMTMTLASITVSHPSQVHILLRPRRKDIMSISRPTSV